MFLLLRSAFCQWRLRLMTASGALSIRAVENAGDAARGCSQANRTENLKLPDPSRLTKIGLQDIQRSSRLTKTRGEGGRWGGGAVSPWDMWAGGLLGTCSAMRPGGLLGTCSAMRPADRANGALPRRLALASTGRPRPSRCWGLKTWRFEGKVM